MLYNDYFIVFVQSLTLRRLRDRQNYKFISFFKVGSKLWRIYKYLLCDELNEQKMV